MDTRHLPRTPGIYRIVNTATGRQYVGSAVDVQKRAQGHRADLRAGAHANAKLQRAWAKYGPGTFAVSVLEPVSDAAALVAREQHWLDVTQAVRTGYNIAPRAGSQLGTTQSAVARERISVRKARPVTGFITPDGHPVTILNLGQFCREQGLTDEGMRALASGRATSHKGWTHVNAKPKARAWTGTYEGFVAPDGSPVPPVTNLTAFCRARGLNVSGMRDVHAGARPSHKEWTHVHDQRTAAERRATARHVRTYPGFVSPTGERAAITNLTKFCREHGLRQASMHRVYTGNEPSHRGWTYDHTAKETV